MVNRITFYEKDKLYPNMIIEIYANRRDKLLHRVRLNEVVHEFFHAGRSHGLKEHIMVNGKTKEMKFYGSARPDGLVNRTEDVRKVHLANLGDFPIRRSRRLFVVQECYL